MRWEKRGLLLPAPPPVDWAVSHTMLPVADPAGDGMHVLFAARDGQGRSHIGRASADLKTGTTQFENRPLLSAGRLGAFDDSGVNPSCILRTSADVLLYTIGWRRGISVPFYLGIGCASSHDGGTTFERVSDAPLVPCDELDPYFVTAPWVLADDGRYRMWYVSCSRWENGDGGPRYWSTIKHAESADGLAWERTGHSCLAPQDAGEHALGRPCVVKDGNLYRMWFSHRGDAYRIGYAESWDGLAWERQSGTLELEPSREGWDSEMVEYANVFDYGGRRYLLYNGNGFGATGIGYATLVAE